MKTCTQCGKEFIGKRTTSRMFCSQACYHEHDRGSIHVPPVMFTCKMCGNPFTRGQGELRSYRKKHGRDPLYCSTKCGGKGRHLTDAQWDTHCVQCGKLMPIQRRPGGTINRKKKLCSTACRSQFRSERAPKLTEITRETKKNGYVWLSIPIHLSGTGKRERVQEHRKVMEEILGRPLVEGEEIHHLNCQRGDNRGSNLQLWSTRQPKGQLIPDKIAFAIEMIKLYPQFAQEAGYELHEVAKEPHAGLLAALA